jgi:hypothetical protein
MLPETVISDVTTNFVPVMRNGAKTWLIYVTASALCKGTTHNIPHSKVSLLSFSASRFIKSAFGMRSMRAVVYLSHLK